MLKRIVNWRAKPIALVILIILLANACSPLEEKNGTDTAGTIPPATTTTNQQPSVALTFTNKPEITSEPKDTKTPLPTVTNTTEPPTVAPTDTAQPTATATAVPTDLALDVGDLEFYPKPAIYEGDLVSIGVNPFVPDHLAPNDVDVLILLDGSELSKGNLNWRNLNGDAYGLFQWVWETDDQAGTHTLTAVVDPEDLIQIGDDDTENNIVSLDIEVFPRSSLPELAATATWITTSTECCNLRVVSGTAAHRDLEDLSLLVDSAFSHASEKLREPLQGPYDVFLIDRVIGQGGYASDGMVVSYLDRDYAGSGIYEVLVHEAVHLMDRQFAPKRISFLSEGLAVWATGGHYRQENINQKMAGLIEGGYYIPIDQVINEIYSLQHELSYLEAASFLSYLFDTYGRSNVRDFYSDTGGDDGITLSQAVDSNLQKHFAKSLEEMEADWMAYLEEQPRDRKAVLDLRTTIRYYDVMRSYQQQYDPSAYYLYAWLPSPREAEENAATADLTRHPETVVNIALETILMAANRSIGAGEFALANAYLDTVERILENGGQFLDPLADYFLNIVQAAEQGGYEVQQIYLSGDSAHVLATLLGEMELTELKLELSDNKMWVLAQ
jgi:hypothetical protein